MKSYFSSIGVKNVSSIRYRVQYPPKLTSYPGNFSVVEGQVAKFVCQAHARPESIQWKWLFNGEVIEGEDENHYTRAYPQRQVRIFFLTVQGWLVSVRSAYLGLPPELIGIPRRKLYNSPVDSLASLEAHRQFSWNWRMQYFHPWKTCKKSCIFTLITGIVSTGETLCRHGTLFRWDLLFVQLGERKMGLSLFQTWSNLWVGRV